MLPRSQRSKGRRVTVRQGLRGFRSGQRTATPSRILAEKSRNIFRFVFGAVTFQTANRGFP
ncbi:hypothetical protein GZL_06292 [Streptomyces sp. 769]|nr:hypothetical protein GZL_06292 [Streptomyces sp. 769]